MGKKCTGCAEVKDFSDFAKNRSKKDGLQDLCRPCSTVAHREFYLRNKERLHAKRRESHANRTPEQVRQDREKRKQYRLENRDRLRDQKAEQRLKLSPGTRQDLLEEQNGCCAICGKPETEEHRLHIDHCYATQQVRGLLCNNCNLAIGLLRDDEDVALAAAEYIRRHK